jgi:hypothetical protein
MKDGSEYCIARSEAFLMAMTVVCRITLSRREVVLQLQTWVLNGERRTVADD